MPQLTEVIAYAPASPLFLIFAIVVVCVLVYKVWYIGVLPDVMIDWASLRNLSTQAQQSGGPV